MARGTLALHRVSYRPDSSLAPDYLICRQAGFILRLFDTPPEKRFDFAGSLKVLAAVERLVKAHPVAKMVPPEALPQFCQILYDGLMSPALHPGGNAGGPLAGDRVPRLG